MVDNTLQVFQQGNAVRLTFDSQEVYNNAKVVNLQGKEITLKIQQNKYDIVANLPCLRHHTMLSTRVHICCNIIY